MHTRTAFQTHHRQSLTVANFNWSVTSQPYLQFQRQRAGRSSDTVSLTDQSSQNAVHAVVTPSQSRAQTLVCGLSYILAEVQGPRMLGRRVSFSKDQTLRLLSTSLRRSLCTQYHLFVALRVGKVRQCLKPLSRLDWDEVRAMPGMQRTNWTLS